MNDLDEYQQYLELRNLSKGTIKQYVTRLAWLSSDPKEQREFLQKNRKNYMLIHAYRSYIKFKKHKGDLTIEEMYNLLETFKAPKKRGGKHKRKGKAYPKSQWPDLIKNAPHKQAKIGIWLGLQFGLRLSEIRHLRVEDINFSERIIYVQERETDEDVNQSEWNPKYCKERIVPMNDHQVNILKRWIEKRPPNLPHSYVIWTDHHNGKPGPISSVTFQRWCKIADPQLSPHDLRRSYATNLYYKSGKDVKIVQLVLGHSNVAVTSDYLRLEGEEFMDKIRKAMS